MCGFQDATLFWFLPTSWTLVSAAHALLSLFLECWMSSGCPRRLICTHSLVNLLILKSHLCLNDYQTDTSNLNLDRIPSWHIRLLVHSSIGISPRTLTINMSENKHLPAPPQTCSFRGSLHLVSGNLVPPVALANYQAPSLTPSSHPASITSANPMSSTFQIYPNPTTSQHLHCHQSRLSHRHLRPELLH